MPIFKLRLDSSHTADLKAAAAICRGTVDGFRLAINKAVREVEGSGIFAAVIRNPNKRPAVRSRLTLTLATSLPIP